MTAGLIQLVAYGIEDLFLTGDPQITFFKVVYRRHTNFTVEQVPQTFNVDTLKFGKKVTCTLSRVGDLAYRTYFVADLPVIPQFLTDTGVDMRTKFAWVRRVGFAMLKTVEIEIGGQSIDIQNGEWMNIWVELAYPPMRGLEIMLGNVPALTKFSNGKDTFRIYVPLQFWFCRFNGLALPIVSLQYNEVKINIELQQPESCYLVGPTYALPIEESMVHFKPFEYIQQTVNGVQAVGIFMEYDITTKLLYYIRITDSPFVAFNTSVFTDANITPSPQIESTIKEQYTITSSQSCQSVTPQDNTTEITQNIVLPRQIIDLTIANAFLDVEYVYLDLDERSKFIHTPQEYLIEQIQIVKEKIVQSNVFNAKIPLNQPTKELFFVLQLNTSFNANDSFNYTDLPDRIVETDEFIGKGPLLQFTLLFNGTNRFEMRQGNYFNWTQPYQHHLKGPPLGIYVYSFCLYPQDNQPSASCNMSKIDEIELALQFTSVITLSNFARLRVYALNYNILRVIYGLGGILFTN